MNSDRSSSIKPPLKSATGWPRGCQLKEDVSLNKYLLDANRTINL